MAKLKLNLPTGAQVEKPVVTCFKVEDKSYLILDAENIGSMGLPIILVCKIENNRVLKITDPAEWQKAKDYLKGIIAGNSMDYLSVAAEMPADEVYYTQLTLPVASFDVIKNSYKVEEPVAPVIEPATPVVEPIAPVADPTPIVETPVADAPVIDIAMPTGPVGDVGSTPVIPTVDPLAAPVIPEMPVNEPVIPTMPNDPVIPVAPTIESAPVNQTKEIDFSANKEAFMKACENMFDALVAKFQAELDSKE